MLPDNWSDLSAAEKYEFRMNSWMDPQEVVFGPGAGEKYRQRARLIRDALELRKPERLPICPMISFYPVFHAGLTAEEAMYDYSKLGMAMRRFHEDFAIDSLVGAFLYGPGKIFEVLDYKLYKWPGHGCDPKTPYQCWEAEYMHASEYDMLINDPTNFWIRAYFPRIFGALAPWQTLTPFTDVVELPLVGSFLIPFGSPEVQESMEKFLEAGRLAREWITAIGTIDRENLAAFGTPRVKNGFSKAPFDTLGDTLRGTEPLMLDLFRRPKDVHRALEALIPMNIDVGTRSATTNNCPFVFMPLHKGADGFMSNKQFAEFYWPSLKAVILGLINEGCVPLLFVEGGYNQRLEFLADPEIPEGRTLWFFDTTEMDAVRKALHGKSCYAGNVPGSLFKAGTPEQVRAYVRNLIDSVGRDGGFILSNGTSLDDAHPENFQAMINTGLEYGS